MSTTTVDEQQRQAIEQYYGPLGPYTVELTGGVTVTADDGVGLNGTLAFPAGLDKVPAVLMRTPYNPASFPPEVAAFYMGEVIPWASHGYASSPSDSSTFNPGPSTRAAVTSQRGNARRNT